MEPASLAQHEEHSEPLVAPTNCVSIRLPSVKLIAVPEGSAAWVEMPGVTGSLPVGRAVPANSFSCTTSAALMTPLTLTSERKLLLPTTCPTRDLVCARSP